MTNCPIEDEAWIFYRDLELMAAEYPDADPNELELALLGHEPQHSIYFSKPKTKENNNE